MDLAEVREHGLGAKPQHTGAAGMVPSRSVSRDLSAVGVKAKGGKRREDVSLHVEHVGFFGRLGPMAANAGKTRSAGAYTRRNLDLIFGLVSAISLAKLEKREILEAAVAIALRGRQQPRQQARAHRGHLDGDRVRQLERLQPSAEQLRMPPRNEGPGDGFDQSATGKNPARPARPTLRFRQYCARHAMRAGNGR